MATIISLVGRTGMYSPAYNGTLHSYARHIRSSVIQEIELALQSFNVNNIIAHIQAGGHVTIDARGVGAERVNVIENALALQLSEKRITQEEYDRVKVWCK